MPVFTCRPLPLFFAVCSPFALAQTPAEPSPPLHEPQNIEEIIVTASPFAKTTENLARPASVLTAENLQQAASASLGETLNGQLGVASASFGPGVGLPIIRGQSDNRVKVMQDSLSTLDASAASPDHATALEPLLAERIEVLRGPAALRYGPGAIGGVVNVLDERIPSQAPSAPITGAAEMRHSSVNNQKAALGKLQGGLGPVALYADALTRDNDNLSIPGFAALHPDENSPHGEVPNTAATADSHTLGGAYIGSQGYIGLSQNHLKHQYGVPPEGDEWVNIHLEQTRTDLKGELNQPFSGFSKAQFRLGHNQYQHVEVEGETLGTQFKNNAHEGRLELLHLPLAGWQGAVGLQTTQGTFSALGEEAFIPEARKQQLGFFILEETTQGAFTYELGARSDTQHISSTAEPLSLRHNSLNLSSAATWQAHPQHRFSAGVTRAQRAPSLEELLAQGPHPATGSYLQGSRQLGNETSHNVEVGYHWHQGPVEVTLQGFYNRFNDYIYAQNQQYTIDELNAYQYTQANATFHGAEFETLVQLSKGWQWRLMADQVNARLNTGGHLPRIPPMRYSSALGYQGHAFSAQLQWQYLAAQNHPGEGETPTENAQTLNAHADYHFQMQGIHYSLFLKGNNLTNAEVRNATSFLRERTPEAGRNLQLGLRLAF